MLSWQLSQLCARPGRAALDLHYAEGQTIYRQDDTPRCWYEVKEGIVRACRYSSGGDRHITCFFYPGDVFGLDKDVREETVEAVTAVELACNDFTALDLFPARENPAFEAAIRTMKNCVNLLGLRTAEQRVAAFLLSLAKAIGSGRSVPVPMSRIDIADHLRLTMHTVSRTISHLCSRGIISMRGPQVIEILDESELHIAAGEERKAERPKGRDDSPGEKRYALKPVVDALYGERGLGGGHARKRARGGSGRDRTAPAAA